MKYSNQALRDALNAGICQVSFTKGDGSKRVMNCTLKEDLMVDNTSVVSASQNEEVIPVFDTDVNGWRSFRVDSVNGLVTNV